MFARVWVGDTRYGQTERERTGHRETEMEGVKGSKRGSNIKCMKKKVKERETKSKIGREYVNRDRVTETVKNRKREIK
jgi:hypothetical protein